MTGHARMRYQRSCLGMRLSSEQMSRDRLHLQARHRGERQSQRCEWRSPRCLQNALSRLPHLHVSWFDPQLLDQPPYAAGAARRVASGDLSVNQSSRAIDEAFSSSDVFVPPAAAVAVAPPCSRPRRWPFVLVTLALAVVPVAPCSVGGVAGVTPSSAASSSSVCRAPAGRRCAHLPPQLRSVAVLQERQRAIRW